MYVGFFPHFSERFAAKPQKSEPIGMEALVRVFTTAPIMLTLLEESDRIAQQLVKDLDIALPEDEDEIVEPI